MILGSDTHYLLKDIVKDFYPCINCIGYPTCINQPLRGDCYKLLDFLLKDRKDESLLIKSHAASDTCGIVLSHGIYIKSLKRLKEVYWTCDCRYCGYCKDKR